MVNIKEMIKEDPEGFSEVLTEFFVSQEPFRVTNKVTGSYTANISGLGYRKLTLVKGEYNDLQPVECYVGKRKMPIVVFEARVPEKRGLGHSNVKIESMWDDLDKGIKDWGWIQKEFIQWYESDSVEKIKPAGSDKTLLDPESYADEPAFGSW